MSGVLDLGKVEPVPPDVDCYKTFCEGDGKKYCDNNQVRVLNVEESESLGPYAARYFASKLWFGEQWYMQIDAHMTFAQDWDATSVEMLQRAPSEKPIISHYPPSHTEDPKSWDERPGTRICGPVFAQDGIENQIIRLEETRVSCCIWFCVVFCCAFNFERIIDWTQSNFSFLYILQVYDREYNEVPRFAPFVAAGYFVAHSEFLREGT